MCGRYASSRRPEDLAEEFEIDRATLTETVAQPLDPDFNVAPTKPVYAVVSRPAGRGQQQAEDEPEDGAAGAAERQLRVLRWGLVPFWAKDPAIGNRLINARMETVGEKPAFRQAFTRRRCLLPADGYFEWYPTQQKTKAGKPLKQPFFIRPKDDRVMAMAGLYEIWRDPTRDDDDPERFRWTCTVLTTTAEDEVGRIHDRMPMLVEPERYAAWLDPSSADPEELKGLLVPAAPGRLEAYPVSTQVNSVRNNGPELLDPLPVEDLPADLTATDGPESRA
jgi:putative SOS response-associated peptidase YedK